MNFKKVLLAATLFSSMGISAMAQEATVTPYAGIRYFFGAYYQNKDMTGNSADVDLANTLVNSSRLGVKFEKSKLSGQAELGIGPGHGGLVSARAIYVQYKADNSLTVLVGQTHMPWYMQTANEAYDQHGGPGSSHSDRAPQIKLSYMGAYLLLAKQAVSSSNQNDGYKADIYNGQDVYMPVTGIGYAYKSDAFDIEAGFAGYKYKINDMTKYTGFSGNLKPEKDTLAYIGYVNANIKFGDAYVKLHGAYEQAPMLIGLSQSQSHFKSASDYIKADTEKPDDNFVEGLIEFGYKTPLGLFATSFGYTRNISHDGDGSADRLGIGVQLAIELEKGFSIVPTVFYRDELENVSGAKQGADMLAGLEFRADL